MSPSGRSLRWTLKEFILKPTFDFYMISLKKVINKYTHFVVKH